MKDLSTQINEAMVNEVSKDSQAVKETKFSNEVNKLVDKYATTADMKEYIIFCLMYTAYHLTPDRVMFDKTYKEADEWDD